MTSSELNDYISSLTGKEVDASILAILGKFIHTFNDRSGFNITPEVGDYDASQISVIPPLPSSEGHNLEDIYNVLLDIRNNLTYTHKEVLVGEVTSNFANQTFTLPKPITDFDELEFDIHLDETQWREGIRIVRVDTLMECLQNRPTARYHLLLYGFDNSYAELNVRSTTQLEYIRDQRNWLARIIGVKYNKKVFE